MAAQCLSSLLRYAAPPVTLCVHDGGLEAGDDDALSQSLGATVAAEPSAREAVLERLARFPACRRYRERHVLARKLFDPVLLSGDESVTYCDADVLFRRPFAGLGSLTGGADVVFQQDVQEAYSLRSWQQVLAPRLRLASRVNSGLVAIKCAAFDLDRLEWFLSHAHWQRTPEWVEQTAWALLASRLRARLVEPRQWAIAGEDVGDPIAVHFVAARRALLQPALESAHDRSAEPPEALRSQPAALCGPLSLLRSELARARRRGTSA